MHHIYIYIDTTTYIHMCANVLYILHIRGLETPCVWELTVHGRKAKLAAGLQGAAETPAFPAGVDPKSQFVHVAWYIPGAESHSYVFTSGPMYVLNRYWDPLGVEAIYKWGVWRWVASVALL